MVGSIMAGVDRKTEVRPIDGTPEKRMFWSIVNDYDTRMAVCELVDNAIDPWLSKKANRKPLSIAIDLDADRQLLSIRDNAGGVPLEHLRYLIAPGGSMNNAMSHSIGVFGVGSKRASVALGEHVEIKTRHGKGVTMGIDVTPEWLESPTWQIASYELPDIAQGTTEINVSRLRRPLGQADEEDLRLHLGETYSQFLPAGCTISLNGEQVVARTFETWAFPPDYQPRSMSFDIPFEEGILTAQITGGLITDRDPEGENYGVYFYCNDRLIVKDLKVRDVGYYVSAEAGVPHPDASLCRVVVRLTGPARLMPWTSSKTGINYDHAAFRALRPRLVELVSYFTKVSRRTKDDWDSKIFSHADGRVETVDPGVASAKGKLVLPPLPKGNKSHVEQLKSKNAKVMESEPWTVGLVEAIAAVDLIHRQRLDTRNRIALVLLDSNFEIALKEFIVHRSDLFPKRIYDDAKIAALFSKRHLVIQDVVAQVPALQPYLAKVSHYYLMRNKLIHERATVDITDGDVQNYRATIEAVLGVLFRLKFPK